MPRLGESVREATVTRWLVKVGESVQTGQPLLEVSTDKVDAEVASPATGKLIKIVVDEDQTAKVGATIAVISSG
ncbi:lipoyl domain-containing protein [Streptomyces monashensis]|uniref:lipoyl domain-containing protein n=1 Tax=Streptomyces monashensis TaxID=1678012 RepID=UPI0033F9FF40